MNRFIDEDPKRRSINEYCKYEITFILIYAILVTLFTYIFSITVLAATADIDDTVVVEETVVNSVDTIKPEVLEEPIANVEESLIFPETEETVEETIEEPVEEVPAVSYFIVPMEESLQDHVFDVCGRYGIDPVLVMAIIQKESRFNIGAMGDNGNSYGLMQIQPRWHSARMERLGCTDLLDPYQNVTVGIDILAELFGRGGSLEWVLMSYNGGYVHADNHIANGTISDYAATVKNYMNTIERN